MEEALVLIEKNQIWIYLVLCIFGLVYLRIAIIHFREFRSTFFGLERDHARERLIQSVVMLILVAAGLVATFVAATFGGPSVPFSARPIELPTVSLLSTPENVAVTDQVEVTVTPMDEAILEGLGCSNPEATIFSPENGDSLSGVVDILGAANIPGFAFYKVEIRALTPDSTWHAIGAGTNPICENCDIEELLTRWDTSLVNSGEYALRLTVMDSIGNAPLPCELRVRVLPSE